MGLRGSYRIKHFVQQLYLCKHFESVWHRLRVSQRISDVIENNCVAQTQSSKCLIVSKGLYTKHIFDKTRFYEFSVNQKWIAVDNSNSREIFSIWDFQNISTYFWVIYIKRQWWIIVKNMNLIHVCEPNLFSN